MGQSSNAYAGRTIALIGTVATDQHQTVAGFIGTVFVVAGSGFAMRALADILGLVAEFMAHPAIEDVE